MPSRPAVTVWRLSLGRERVRTHVPRAVRRTGGDPSPFVRVRPRPGAHQAGALRDHQLARGQNPQLGIGERLLDCVYAEDVARAYVDAAVGIGVEGRTIDIGRGDHDVSARDRAADRRAGGTDSGAPAVSASLPVRPLEQKVEVDADRTASGCSDWRATTSLEDGLEATVAWFRGHATTLGPVGRAAERPECPSRWMARETCGAPTREQPCRRSISTPRSYDERRRHRLYAGDLFVFSPGPSATTLTELARELSEAAFAPHDPQVAQESMPAERYVEILAELKPRFIHHPRAKELIAGLLSDLGCDIDRTYFDVPRLRTMAHGEYLKAGLAYQFHPHRDTWFSAPMQQLNWWLPVYDVESRELDGLPPAVLRQAGAQQLRRLRLRRVEQDRPPGRRQAGQEGDPQAAASPRSRSSSSPMSAS